MPVRPLRFRRVVFLLCALAVGLAVLASEPPTARGEEPGTQELAAVVKKGETLWQKSWRPAAKACFACHLRGPNKMTSLRLKSYPKYDPTLRKVVTAQEKIVQMLRSKSAGPQLELGHEDLTALEAYISTLR